MQQNSHRLAIALGLAAATPGFAQPQPTEPTRPPERIAPSAAPVTPATNTPGAASIAPGAASTGPAAAGGTQSTAPRPASAQPLAIQAAPVQPTPRPGVSTAAAPVAGANSFTEGQARSRIEAAGFTQVSNLAKQDDGIWRGEAMRGGSRVIVMLDFHGDVSARP